MQINSENDPSNDLAPPQFINQVENQPSIDLAGPQLPQENPSQPSEGVEARPLVTNLDLNRHSELTQNPLNTLAGQTLCDNRDMTFTNVQTPTQSQPSPWYTSTPYPALAKEREMCDFQEQRPLVGTCFNNGSPGLFPPDEHRSATVTPSTAEKQTNHAILAGTRRAELASEQSYLPPNQTENIPPYIPMAAHHTQPDHQSTEYSSNKMNQIPPQAISA